MRTKSVCFQCLIIFPSAFFFACAEALLYLVHLAHRIAKEPHVRIRLFGVDYCVDCTKVALHKVLPDASIH